MSADFLPDLAVELDPRRCGDIIAGMPADQIAEVAEILARRDEHVAMGRFVGHMTDEAIEESLAVIDEPALCGSPTSSRGRRPRARDRPDV